MSNRTLTPERLTYVISSVPAWCKMLNHQCDGVEGTCCCECHFEQVRVA